jgi:hypothetical protein
MADFTAGRVLTEEQFDEEMRRYFERREAQEKTGTINAAQKTVPVPFSVFLTYLTAVRNA